MLEKGQVVSSIAGRDKNQVFVVLARLQDRVLIANGKERRLAAPKAKNAKHLQATKMVIDLNLITSDKCLKRVLAVRNQPVSSRVEEGGN